MAGPLRFRHSTERWSEDRVQRDLLSPLQDRFGATMNGPWFAPPEGWAACRLEMDNGDLALFAWNGQEAYWMGNTETPETLWRTEKYTFEETSDPIAEWGERELLAQLEVEDPWLTDYEHVAHFFLPVFLSKDGRDSTRTFFDDHAGGFPDATRDEGLRFYDDFLGTGVLDDYRYTMASKLGTSQGFDLSRMQATMGEFNVAKLLADAGNDFEPEVQLGSGHAIDFRVEDTLVEVTRPRPPARRQVNTAVAAVKASGDAKTRDQLAAHPGAVLVVDATSFADDEWRRLAGERPEVGYQPLVVFRYRPDGRVEGYTHGSIPFPLPF
ncbi:DUF5784 family protein [Halomicroarcula sp. GCM10025324]|uniref:DUF5784 family protein n=1 Tax=Haloarcula TaxID=2237 RepID=UPI0023E7C9BA|nr:DUF5784 family protein [Halomicroarcula sp. ZS-22-S1]